MFESLARSDGPPRQRAASRSVATRLVHRVLAAAGDPPLAFRLWTGEIVKGNGATPLATLELRDAQTLWRLLRDPQRAFAEGYASGAIGFSGDLTGFLVDIYERGAARRLSGNGLALRPPRARARAGSLETARDNIHRHYDLGNAFYRLWLDPTLSYTCAYYPNATATLAEAQLAKIHHVARKLRLGVDELVIDAGCGWGGFAITAARRYGVRVRAFNISREQIEYARDAARQAGVADRVTFIEDDYRNISGRCDAFVSIGMLEHVGVAAYTELGHLINRSLGPNGRGLVHSIGRSAVWPLSPWIRDRIFPGAEVPSLAEIMTVFAPDELAVLDVENLRPHYALTVRDWLAAFEGAADQVKSMFDEEFVRAWRLYLAGSCAAFMTGELQLFQVLFTARTNLDWPLTRAHLYADA